MLCNGEVPRFERSVLSAFEEVRRERLHQGVWRAHDISGPRPNACPPCYVRVQVDVFPSRLDEHRLGRTVVPNVSRVSRDPWRSETR